MVEAGLGFDRDLKRHWMERAQRKGGEEEGEEEKEERVEEKADKVHL
jgi:hypothetical protein